MRNIMMEHAQMLAAFALRSEGGEISYDLAAHLAYLADRLCLGRHGFPVVSDRRVSVMGSAINCGVMRTVFDGFNPEVRGERMFAEVGQLSCRVSGHLVEEDLDLHSIAVTKVIEDTWSQYGRIGVESIRATMSDRGRFPEIKSNGSGSDISLKDILSAHGYADAEAMEEEILAHERIDILFAVLELR